MTQPWHGATERFVMVALLALLTALAPATAAAQRTLLVMGDSLSAAYGLSTEQGWVHLLDARIAERMPGWKVVNASVSGETTDGGASRIGAELTRHKPELVVIELGANDGLRGLPLDRAQANLERMITAARGAGADVVLLGMRIPPNYGPDYTRMFEAMYRDLAAKHQLGLLPFLLEPVAADRDAFLPDNLHPTAASQPKLLEHVWTVLEPALQARATADAAG